jgi:outer membrane protein OmpA-like peptidoglycan-associated protein
MDGLSIWLVSLFIWSLMASQSAPPFKETMILLPEVDGKTSAIVIKTETKEALVTEPYHAVEVKGGNVVSKTLSEKEVQQLYPEVMQAIPEKPRSFILFFEENGKNLSSESQKMIEDVKQEIAKRAAPEISVIGHTDRTGSKDANLKLSFDRATEVRDILVTGGIPTEIIQIIGRGELDPAVITEDGVAEPLNRRVEITVR